MAFAFTITEFIVQGEYRWAFGTYVSDGSSTGGDIDIGLKECHQIRLQPKGSAVVDGPPIVDETLPASGGAVTIKTTSNESGYWIAFGK